MSVRTYAKRINNVDLANKAKNKTIKKGAGTERESDLLKQRNEKNKQHIPTNNINRQSASC